MFPFILIWLRIIEIANGKHLGRRFARFKVGNDQARKAKNELNALKRPEYEPMQLIARKYLGEKDGWPLYENDEGSTFSVNPRMGIIVRIEPKTTQP